MTAYRLTIGTCEYEVEANLTEASAPIYVDGNNTPYQTADCRHRDSELARLLAEWILRDEMPAGDERDELVSDATIEAMDD